MCSFKRLGSPALLSTHARLARWSCVVAGIFLAACMEPVVLGHIPPTAFHFTSVVPRSGSEAGGWKVAQVVILLGRLAPRYPETALCEIEVGVPEFNKDGVVLDEVAQVKAAQAADVAAARVLKERLPTAMACDELRKTMQRIMGDPANGTLPGTRVRSFITPGLPRTTFP
jgi:hypothetical protein